VQAGIAGSCRTPRSALASGLGSSSKATHEYFAGPYSVRSEIAASVDAKARAATLHLICDQSETPQEV